MSFARTEDVDTENWGKQCKDEDEIGDIKPKPEIAHECMTTFRSSKKSRIFISRTPTNHALLLTMGFQILASRTLRKAIYLVLCFQVCGHLLKTGN